MTSLSQDVTFIVPNKLALNLFRSLKSIKQWEQLYFWQPSKVRPVALFQVKNIVSRSGIPHIYTSIATSKIGRGSYILVVFCDAGWKTKTSCIKCTLIFVLDEVWQVLEATGFTDKYDSQIYLSVHDAVLAATVEGEGEYGNEVGSSGSQILSVYC